VDVANPVNSLDLLAICHTIGDERALPTPSFRRVLLN
jgi:hypothetical protein